MLRSRVITAIVLLALLLAALFGLPSYAWALLVGALLMQGSVEWSRLSGFVAAKARLYQGLTLLLLLGLYWLDSAGLNLYMHMAVYGVAALLWLAVVPAWLKYGWKIREPALMALTGWAVLIPTGLAMLDLRAYSPLTLLLVLGLVWVADIAAYFAGRRFGKNKLAPGISPGKTWEGVAGAVLGVSVYVALLWVCGLAKWVLLPAAWFWVALAVMGDLFESAIKRQAGVKDSGSLLPGHGGLLDRIDALTSTLPLAALVLLLQNSA